MTLSVPPARAVRRLALTAIALACACRAGAPGSHAGFVDAPQAQVAAQVAGRVDAILVREGDRVKKGQLLVRLDSSEREALLRQAQASLGQAQAALREADANLRAVQPGVAGAGADIARAQATLDEAEAAFARTQELARGDAASTQDLDTARARLMEARAGLQSLTAGKSTAVGRVGVQLAAAASARARLDVAEAAVRLAEVQLAQDQVLCPFDGLVVNRNLEEGEWAAPGTPVVTVENTERRWVRLDVGEGELAGLEPGAQATVTLAALPGRTFRGQVAEVGAEGDFAVNRDVKRGRPDLRTFRVRVALEGVGDEVRPGMTAEVMLSAPASPSPPLAPGEPHPAAPAPAPSSIASEAGK
jgi:HlyD family secretion protein